MNLKSIAGWGARGDGRGETADCRLQTVDFFGRLGVGGRGAGVRCRSSVFRLRSAVFSFPKSAVFPLPLLTLLVFSLQSSVFSLASHANLTNTWQFTNAANYEVSDPALIRVPG